MAGGVRCSDCFYGFDIIHCTVELSLRAGDIRIHVPPAGNKRQETLNKRLAVQVTENTNHCTENSIDSIHKSIQQSNNSRMFHRNHGYHVLWLGPREVLVSRECRVQIFQVTIVGRLGLRANVIQANAVQRRTTDNMGFGGTNIKRHPRAEQVSWKGRAQPGEWGGSFWPRSRVEDAVNSRSSAADIVQQRRLWPGGTNIPNSCPAQYHTTEERLEHG